ncbi:CRAL-TRIO domain-containing protein [Scheffersomyces amazonensis]|uniref:CRAL-TRIO domain-containing protein n=1 Tax=Scheffersomyces amazonensis TaxID=1078765 RepID=UPI00315CF914
MSQYKVRDLHGGFNSCLRNDLVDNFILRFVRARKWKSDAAVQMMLKSLNWRISKDFSPDSWVLEGDAKSFLTGTNKGFVKNFTCEKAFIKGHDVNRNPIYFFQARKHFGSDSPLIETQRFSVVTIEWCRLFLREVTDSVDQCSIVFDLTGFSLKNADYAAIKFLADVFEAHYPETLGVILIHNAPWIFSTVWNIIKNWLDPVVASKIHFTKDAKELSKFVDPKFIPDYLGGQDHTEPVYIEPEESDALPPRRKDAYYYKLKKERDATYLKFIEATIKWIESTNPAISDQYLQDKIRLNYELSNNYLKLDPYIRCRGLYDRDGTLTVSN